MLCVRLDPVYILDSVGLTHRLTYTLLYIWVLLVFDNSVYAVINALHTIVSFLSVERTNDLLLLFTLMHSIFV